MADEDALPATSDELLVTIRDAHLRIETFVHTLSPYQIVGPTDAAGWTVRDHLAHLNAWADSTLGILRDGTPQAVTLQVDAATLAAHDYDPINETIRMRSADQPVEQVIAERQRMHVELDARIRNLPYERLLEPVSAFVAGGNDYPMVGKILGNSAWHDDEHLEWMRAIVDRPGTGDGP